MILVCVFCHFWNPLPVSLTLVPKSGEGVFFLCVFQQQAVQNSLLDGDRSGVQKNTENCRFVGTESGRGKANTLQMQRKQNFAGMLEGARILEGRQKVVIL